MWLKWCIYCYRSIYCRTITVTDPDNNAYDKKIAFKNNAPFTSCSLKINKTLIDNAEYINIVIPMYILIEYSKNYSKTTGSLWNYYRDESKSGAKGHINYSIKDSKFFDYKTRITERLEGNDTEKQVEIVVLLKQINNFWRTFRYTNNYYWNKSYFNLVQKLCNNKQNNKGCRSWSRSCNSCC